MNTTKLFFAAFCALTLGLSANAQGGRPEITVPEGSVAPVTNINRRGYPRILEDNSVMFRIVAPDADNIQVDLCGKKYPMVKDEQGVWTVTTDPQVPGFHYYFLLIDGISVADPASESFYGCSKMSSAIDIPEANCEDFEIQDVPHGEVRLVNYYSKVENAWRPLYVYTPAGYNSSNKKYPVIYIQHGGGEDHRGWMQQGRTANIMDNLIAAGKAVPAIVVSANSNLNIEGRGGRGWSGTEAFNEEMINNIIPFVEANFRVKTGKKNRAMCGLSMGGGHSFYIGFRNPDVFANVGIFSSGMFGGVNGDANLDLEAEIPGMLSKPKAFNRKFDVIYFSCGEQDPRVNYLRGVTEQLNNKKIDAKFSSFPGDHEWQPWRKSLHEFAQMLFK